MTDDAYSDGNEALKSFIRMNRFKSIDKVNGLSEQGLCINFSAD